jgi:hypothetical protein
MIEYYKIIGRGDLYRRRYVGREDAETVRKALRPHGNLRVAAFNKADKIVEINHPSKCSDD